MSRAVDFVDKQILERNQNKSGPGPSGARLGRASKRVFDVVVAFLSLFFLSPLFVFIAIQIKRDSPGPVFYNGPRVGFKGKIFQMYKFRTMYERPESYSGNRLTHSGDNRITPFGTWLRDSKLNELPQLWNVLLGQMSIVGPRPEDPEFVAQWPEDIREEILTLRPGITSPASVTYRHEEEMLNGQSLMDDYLHTILPDKLRLDQLYVRHHNFIGDMDVIFATLTTFVPGFRRREMKERYLFEGLLTRFARKYISWFITDTVVSFLSISLAVLIWRMQSPLDVGFLNMVLVALGLAAGLALTNSLFGLKRVNWRYASPIHVFDIGLSTTLAILFFALLGFLFPRIKLPIGLYVNLGIFSFIGSVAVRYRERLITGLSSRWLRWRSQTALLGERVLVIGAGDCGQLGIWLLEKSRLFGAFSIVGIVDDDFSKLNERISGYPVLGTTRDIPGIVAQKSIGLVMFAINKVSTKDRDRILKICRGLPVRILMIPDLLNLVSDYFTQQVRELKADE